VGDLFGAGRRRPRERLVATVSQHSGEEMADEAVAHDEHASANELAGPVDVLELGSSLTF
jgi:hypothetical protein